MGRFGNANDPMADHMSGLMRQRYHSNVGKPGLGHYLAYNSKLQPSNRLHSVLTQMAKKLANGDGTWIYSFQMAMELMKRIMNTHKNQPGKVKLITMKSEIYGCEDAIHVTKAEDVILPLSCIEFAASQEEADSLLDDFVRRMAGFIKAAFNGETEGEQKDWYGHITNLFNTGKHFADHVIYGRHKDAAPQTLEAHGHVAAMDDVNSAIQTGNPEISDDGRGMIRALKHWGRDNNAPDPIVLAHALHNNTNNPAVKADPMGIAMSAIQHFREGGDDFKFERWLREDHGLSPEATRGVFRTAVKHFRADGKPMREGSIPKHMESELATVDDKMSAVQALKDRMLIGQENMPRPQRISKKTPRQSPDKFWKDVNTALNDPDKGDDAVKKLLVNWRSGIPPKR